MSAERRVCIFKNMFGKFRKHVLQMCTKLLNCQILYIRILIHKFHLVALTNRNIKKLTNKVLLECVTNYFSVIEKESVCVDSSLPTTRISLDALQVFLYYFWWQINSKLSHVRHDTSLTTNQLQLYYYCYHY